MKINCFTCKYGYKDEQSSIQLCHHPKRFSEDCINFNMHEEKESEHLADASKTSPKDLEEASEKYGHNKHPMTTTGAEESQEDFIAGAKWQKEKDDKELSEKIAGSYQLGLYDKEKMMMKDAVEGILVDNIDGTKDICLHENRFGDKVRIIIVKEDEK